MSMSEYLSLGQLGLIAPGNIYLYTTAKRSLCSLSQNFNWDLQLATVQLRVTASTLLFSCISHTEFTVDLVTLRSIPGTADRCFQGRWLSGNKSTEMANLNGPLHSVTGRSNCNRKPSSPTHQVAGRDFMLSNSF